MEAVASCSVTARVAVSAAPVAAKAAKVARKSAVAKAMGGRASAFNGLSGLRSTASVNLSRQAQKSASKRTVTASAAATTTAVDQTTLETCINAIRFLAIDAVEKANSGHPGLPMGCAPMGYILFNETMKFNPKNPKFFNRDRFVLSAGHGCMLQYALLHLTGYDSVKLEDLQQFRQWGSRTPGHPENFETAGVEVTTGPLGQGICNAVGLALAEKHLAARFNKPGMEIVDHYTYCILGDGCNMEGVSNEAVSLAGHWGLGKLIALYDDNHISIDGHTDISFTEDVAKRYEALGWHTIHVKDGNRDYDAIRKAIAEAKKVTDKPTLIKITTIIGYGSPNKADSHDVHGAALGPKEVEATRKNLGWEHAPFVVPAEVRKAMTEPSIAKGASVEAEWNAKWTAYAAKYPKEASELKSIMTGELPAGWEKSLPRYTPEVKPDATRNLSQTCLNALGPAIPGFIGGSADLAPSNMTLMKMFGDFQKNSPAERNLRFGVREHGMGAICNGIALHSPGFVPYCATFFVFTDYMRAAMRMSALSEARVIYVMTHDSIGLGEDGPTHQPVEHIASFRAMPNIYTMRPADGNETAAMYEVAVAAKGTPSLLCLSRQKLPNLPGSTVEKAKHGAYVVSDSQGTPDVIFLATGSEVENAEAAADVLRKEGKNARVVSMPCWEIFEKQTAEYKESVIPAAVKARVVVEAASSFGWQKYAGDHGAYVTVDGWGASAPAPRIYKEYGFGTDAIVAKAKSVMKK